MSCYSSVDRSVDLVAHHRGAPGTTRVDCWAETPTLQTGLLGPVMAPIQELTLVLKAGRAQAGNFVELAQSGNL